MHTDDDPLAIVPGVRAAVHAIDTDLPGYDVTCVRSTRLGESLGRRRVARHR